MIQINNLKRPEDQLSFSSSNIIRKKQNKKWNYFLELLYSSLYYFQNPIETKHVTRHT